MSLTVDDVFIYNGEIEIPEGKVVLLMDTSGVSEYYDFLSRLPRRSDFNGRKSGGRR